MNFLMNDNGELTKFSAHKQPTFKELKNKDWVMWGYSSDYDDKEWNNRQPDYYEWLYNSSSKHRAIINKKVMFIVGQGVAVEDRSLNTSEKVEAESNVFKINDSDLVKKLALNLTKIGGFTYEVIADKAGKKITPHYVNIANVRRNKVEYDQQGRELPPIYYYTKNWDSRKPEENPDFTIFYEWDWEKRPDNSKRYLVYYSEDEENIYPIPEYTAAVPYIASDYEISNFVYNNVKSGLSAGWLVNFRNGEPAEEEKGQIANYFKSRLHGTDNAGEPILDFAEIGSEGVSVTPLSPNGQDDRFINLNKQIREEIYSGHTVSPVVVGLEGNNGFNNNADEKRTATEDFQAFYVRSKQMVLENHLNAIRAYNEVKGKLVIKRLPPLKIEFTETMLQHIYDVDELRMMDGAEPRTDEQKTTVVKETVKEFSTDENIIKFLETCGTYDEEVEVISTHEIFVKDIEDAQGLEQEFLDSLEIIILRLLGANPNLRLEDIAKAVHKPLDKVEPIYNNLKEKGLIDESGEVTEEGETEVNKEPEIFTVYKYAKRSDVSGADILPTTRDFCKNLVRMSRFKSWTLEDIKLMNNGMNLDVFRSRGGWRTIEGTDRHVPYCRHIWVAQVVRRN